jgi:predicted nucleic acid-binding protein
VKLAYIDTSCLLAIAFDEPDADKMAARLRRFDRLLSSNLLEAEVRAALAREGVRTGADRILSWVTWVYPNRPLTEECERIVSLGYLKGADLWHLACALFVDPGAEDLAFLTLDRRQQELAEKLGFRP